MRKTSGVSLMLLIFLSLCLIIFSLLSLSGAVADETLSKQAADRTSEYYTAVTSANHILSQIDTRLAASLKTAEESSETQKEAVYLRLCSQIDESISGVSWENGILSCSVQAGEDQILQIQLDISYPASDEDSLYQIRTWKIVNIDDWTADQSMKLFRSTQ